VYDANLQPKMKLQCITTQAILKHPIQVPTLESMIYRIKSLKNSTQQQNLSQLQQE